MALTAIGLAIRLYLVFASYCISADGPEYVRMARDFAAGDRTGALGSIFSPLYPWLMALVHPLVPNWELSGDLLSTFFGTITIPLVYLLIRQVLQVRSYALGAAAITVIHPLMAEYSSSVRTEAGYVCLMVAALCLLISAIERESLAMVAAAGVVGGLAYLYRAEGFGFLAVGGGFVIAGAWVWRRWRITQGLAWAALLAATFLTVASPYLLYLHRATGRWTVSREFNNSVAMSVMETASNKAPWQALRQAGTVSLLGALATDPQAYFLKVAHDLVFSFYYLAEALGPLLTLLLALGLALRGRKILDSWKESLLLLIAGFYLTSFVLLVTGPRLIEHVIVYTFGWIMIGFERGSEWIGPLPIVGGNRASTKFAIVVALTMLPRTLWPIGYDQRAFKLAGADIRSLAQGDLAVVSSQGQTAYYAGARPIDLPSPRPGNLCRWLAGQPNAAYLMMSRREERNLDDPRPVECLEFVKRYPATGSSYFDLFRIKRVTAAR
jgi:hypothetical protein